MPPSCLPGLTSSPAPPPPHPRPLPCHSHLTCGDKQDARAEDDVVAWLVELAGGDAQPSHEEQDHTQDGEDTGGPYSTWTHVVEKKHYHNYHPGTRAKNMTKNLWKPIFMLKAIFLYFFLLMTSSGVELGNKSALLSWLSSFSICFRYLSSITQSPSSPSFPLLHSSPIGLSISCLSVRPLRGWFADWPGARRGAAVVMEPDRGLGDHQCDITELLIDFVITVYIPAYSAAKMIQLKQICN